MDGLDAVRAVADGLAARHLADGRIPGLAIAVTDRDGVVLEAYHGLADVAARRPVTARTVFQIGSITKVATSILAVRLWEDGTLDPHTPVRQYLDWLPEEPYGWITAHHLMSHTAGLAAGSDVAPPSPYMAIAACFPPPLKGAGFSYSDAGLQVLAIVVEAIAGRPYAELITDTILAPLGMTESFPVIAEADRDHYAVGHTLKLGDRPLAAGDGLAPAPFFGYDAGDGCMACTARDLAAFARMFATGGAGVLTPAGFELLTTPVADTGDGESVCYGIFSGHRYGYRDLNHGGNMVGYDTMLCVDPETGYGVVTLTNGVGDSTPVARGLLDALRRHHAGETPTLPPPAAVPPLSEYTGTYRRGGETLTVQQIDGSLHLGDAPLRRVRGDVFALPGSPFPVRFGRAGDDVVVEIGHGPEHWVTGDHRGETGRAHPPLWDAFVGRYRAGKLFEPTFRIVVRNGKLLQCWPFGREDTLLPTDDPAVFLVEDGRDVMAFDTPAGDRMLRAVRSGCPHYRTLS